MLEVNPKAERLFDLLVDTFALDRDLGGFNFGFNPFPVRRAEDKPKSVNALPQRSQADGYAGHRRLESQRGAPALMKQAPPI